FLSLALVHATVDDEGPERTAPQAELLLPDRVPVRLQFLCERERPGVQIHRCSPGIDPAAPGHPVNGREGRDSCRAGILMNKSVCSTSLMPATSPAQALVGDRRDDPSARSRSRITATAWGTSRSARARSLEMS